MSCGLSWKRCFSLILLFTGSTTFAQVLLPLKMGQKWGYVGSSGEVITEGRYDYAEPFEGRYARARRGDTLIILDKRLNEIVVPSYGNFHVLCTDIVRVYKNNRYGLTHFDGREIFAPGYQIISLAGFRDTFPLFLLEKDGKQGIGTADGNLLIPLVYDSISYRNSHFKVVLNKKTGLLNQEAEKVLEPEFEDIQIYRNYVSVKKKKRFGICNFKGEPLMPVKYDYFWQLNDSVIGLQRGDSSICYHILSGQRFGGESINWFTTLHNGLIAVYNKNEFYDFYTSSGKQVQDGIRAFGYLGENYWWASNAEGLKAITSDSFRFLTSYFFEAIDSVRNNMALIRESGKWGLLHTAKMKTVIPCEFQKILIMEDLIKASGDGIVVTYQLDKNGDILEKNEFRNVVSIKLKQRTFLRSTENVVVRRGNNEWFMERNLWGLRRKSDKKVLIEPQFHMLRSADGAGMTLVGVKILKEIKIAAYMYKITEAVGLVDEDSGIIIAEPKYAYIDEEALNNSDFDFVRVVDLSGYFHLLRSNGELKRLSMHYIERKSANGFSRCFRGKMLPLSKWAPAGFHECRGYRNILLNFSPGRRAINWLDHTVHFKDGYWTYIDDQGNLLPVKFQYAFNYNRNTAIVKQNNLFGLIDRSGQYVILPVNDSLFYMDWSGDSILIAKKQLIRNAYINSHGDLVTGFDFTESGNFREGLAPARLENGKMSFINSQGEFISSEGFQRVFDFSCNRARVILDKRYCYIDRQGHKIGESFNRAENFSEGFALTKTVRDGYMIIDSNGNQVLKYKKETLGAFSQGLAAISNGELFGYVDIDGDMIIPYRFHAAEKFDVNEHAVVSTKRNKGLINKKAEWVIDARYDEIRLISGGNYLAVKGRKHDFYDASGKHLKRIRASEIHSFSEGLARIIKQGKTGFIDSTGNIVIPCSFDMASDFTMGLAIIPNGRRSIVINRKGDTVLNMKCVIKRVLGQELVLVREPGSSYYSIYNTSAQKLMDYLEDALPAGNGLIRFKKNQRWGYLNSSANIILTPRFIQAAEFSDQMAKVTLNQFYEVYDFNGTKLTAGHFETLRYIGDGIFRLEQGNRSSYLRNNGQWIVPMK